MKGLRQDRLRDIPPLQLAEIDGAERSLVVDKVATAGFGEAVRLISEQIPGEPFYLLNEGALRSRVREMRETFMGEMAYCLKANGDKNVLRVIMEEGINTFDCASLEEAQLALEMNPEAKVLMNNPKRSLGRLRREIELGANHWTIDTRNQLDAVLSGVLLHSKREEKPEIAVRMATSNQSALQDLSKKFGSSRADSELMVKELKQGGIVKVGLSIHIGSQNSDVQVFVDGLRELMASARSWGGVDFVNIGGGPPVNYYADHNYVIREYLEATNDAIWGGDGIQQGTFTGEPEIYFEPGRSVVAESVDLVVPAWDLIEKNGVKHLFLSESVYGAFAAAAVHDWHFRIEPLVLDGPPLSKETEEYVVWGRTCDSGDVLVGSYHFPVGIKAEDVMGKFEDGSVVPGRVTFYVPTAGAYMRSCTSAFNLFSKPKYGHFACNS